MSNSSSSYGAGRRPSSQTTPLLRPSADAMSNYGTKGSEDDDSKHHNGDLGPDTLGITALHDDEIRESMLNF